MRQWPAQRIHRLTKENERLRKELEGRGQSVHIAEDGLIHVPFLSHEKLLEKLRKEGK